MDNEKTTPVAEETAAEEVKDTKKEKKPSKTAQLEQKLAAKEEELAAMTDQEKLQIGAYTKADVLTALLTSVDNMEKAIAAPAGDDYKTGVDLVLRQFMEALEKLGLESVGVEGEPFDPNVHNAVMREDADGIDEETVTAVFQKGYKLGDRVLRPAMVKVAN